MKFLFGGILQESNTFSPITSSLQQFRDHVLLMDNEVLKLEESSNEIAGFLKAAHEYGGGLQVVPTIFANAVSSGKITREALKELKNLLTTRIRGAHGYDGVLLALHGAMVAEDCDDAEGEILSEVREIVGPDIPIMITLDLHANVTRQMIESVSGVVGYHTFPHVDFLETGYKAAKLLISMVERRERFEVILRKIPMILPAENMQTTRGPMHRLIQEAISGEKSGVSLATSIIPVQPWLDIDELGFAIVVVSTDREQGEQEAERLAELAWELREEFQIKLHSVQETVEFALSSGRSGPVIISDSADSPGAGATGDSNYVIREFIRLHAQTNLTCLVTIVDAPAVSKAIEAGLGQEIELVIGYTINSRMGSPYQIRGKVVRITDGRFLFQKGYAANTQGNMGRCAVVQIEKLYILICDKATFTGDPEMYRSVGLEPATADIVVVKSANQFRGAYEELSDHIYILDTPGVSSANLTSLTFNKINRPFYPFDDWT